MAVIIGLFVAVFAAVFGVVWMVERYSTGKNASEPTSTELGEWYAPAVLKDESLSTISVWETILARYDGIQTIRTHISEAGLRWSAGRLTAMMLLSGAATGVVSWRLAWFPPGVTIALGILAGVAPYKIVLRRRRQRLAEIEKALPDALDSLARSIRAGNAFAAAVDLLSRETPAPLGAEFRRLVDERLLGLDWDIALANFAERLPVTEIRIFVAAVSMHNRTGGKLHEVFGRLAESMRETAMLRGEIQSVAAHGRSTGKLLTALPFVISGMMMYVNPSWMFVLWTNPTGRTLIWVALGCLVLAWYTIRRMVEVRW